MRSIYDRLYSKKNAQSYNGKKKRLSLQHDRKSLEKQSKRERNSFKVEVKTFIKRGNKISRDTTVLNVI